MMGFFLQRARLGHALLIVVLMLAAVLVAQPSAQAQSNQTIRFVCADRAGQLFVVGGSNACPSGFTRVDLSGTSPAVTVCLTPIINMVRLAGQPIPCTFIEQTVILHGPTETVVCSSMSLNRSFRLRMRLAGSSGQCRSGEYTLRIPPGNPIAVNDSYVTGINTPLVVPAPGVLANDTGNSGTVNGDTVSSQGGTVILASDGGFTYIPPTGFTGTDTSNYSVNNGTTSSSATVTITVMQFPDAVDDEYIVDDTFTGFVASPGVLGNDAVNGATLAPYTGPTAQGGSVTLNADGSFTYTAPVTPVPTDAFTYTITNPVGSDTATVTMVFNNPPVAIDDDYATDQDSQVSGNALTNDTDPDLDLLTVTAVNGDPTAVGTQVRLPSGALVTLNANGSFAWLPDDAFDFLGVGVQDTDSFSYTISDGKGGTDSAFITITITGVNDAPTAVDDDYSTSANTVLTIAVDDGLLANDTDPDGDTLRVSRLNNTDAFNGIALTLPSGAILTGALDGGFIYNPNGRFQHLGAGESTTDLVQYEIDDGKGGTDSAFLTITINGGNDSPTANDQTLQTDEDTPISITLTATDPDANDILTFDVQGGPSNGTLTGTEPNLTYQPNPEFAGSDSFTFVVSDGKGGTDTGTITITVIGVNDAPILADIETTNLAYTENDPATQITATLTVTDLDTDQLASATVTISSGYVNGEDVLAFTTTSSISGTFDTATGILTLTGPASVADFQAALRSVTYANTSDNPGTSKTISVQVNDGEATNNTSNIVQRTIAITPVNDPPQLTVPGAQSVNEDTNLTINGISVTDVDAGPGQVKITLTAQNGTITLAGTTGLSFTIGDGTADSTMTFTGTLANVSAALNGLIYRGTEHLNDTRGDASLTITVDDQGNTGGGPQTDSKTIDITVNPVNDPPVVASRDFQARAHLTLTVADTTTQGGHLLHGVTDPDAGDGGYVPNFNIIVRPGTISPDGAVVEIMTNGAFSFDAPPGYVGDVTFGIQVCDSGYPDSACAIATITVAVGGPVIWFIDNTASAGGNGTLAQPFNSVSAYEAVRTQISSPVEAGDIIFIAHTGTNYTGPLTLLNNQLLLGEGATGGTFQELTGARTPPAGSATYPTLSSNKPILTAASGVTLTLAANNTVNGIELQGTATAVVVGSTAAVIGNVTFTSSPITQAGSRDVIIISSRVGGTVTFDATTPIVATAVSNDGIVLNSNPGTIFAFNGGLTLGRTSPTPTGSRFQATNGGTVTVASNVVNTINAVNATALTVSNMTIGSAGMTFRSISANGGTNGIVLTNTGSVGGLTITGDGNTTLGGNASGGTIQNSTEVGIALSSTRSVSLTNVTVRDTASHGISGTVVNGLTFNYGTILRAGDAQFDNALSFNTTGANNLSGTVSIIGSRITEMAYWGLVVENYSGTASITVRDSEFSNNVGNFGIAGFGEDAILFDARGSSTITALVDNSDFFGLESDAVAGIAQDFSGGTPTLNLTVNGSEFTGSPQGTNGSGTGSDNALSLRTGGTGVFRFTVENNMIRNSNNSAIIVQGNDNGIIDGRLITNTIDTVFIGMGIDGGGLGDTDSEARLLVQGNTIIDQNKEAMFFNANDTSEIDVTVLNNTMNSMPPGVGTWENLTVQGQGTTDVCANVQGNSIAAGGTGIGDTPTNSLYLYIAPGGTHQLERGASGSNDPATVATDNNTLLNGVLIDGTITVVDDGTCELPLATPQP